MKLFRKSLLLIICICLALPLALTAANKLGWLLIPEKASSRVNSPDEKFYAYVGYRGFLDNMKASLYVVSASGSVNQRADVFGSDVRLGEPVWSPDSSRVAMLLLNDFSASPRELHVLDVQNRIHVVSYDMPEVKDTLQGIQLKWLDKRTLCLVAEYVKSPDRIERKTVGIFDLLNKKSTHVLVRRDGLIQRAN